MERGEKRELGILVQLLVTFVYDDIDADNDDDRNDDASDNDDDDDDESYILTSQNATGFVSFCRVIPVCDALSISKYSRKQK